MDASVSRKVLIVFALAASIGCAKEPAEPAKPGSPTSLGMPGAVAGPEEEVVDSRDAVSEASAPKARTSRSDQATFSPPMATTPSIDPEIVHASPQEIATKFIDEQTRQDLEEDVLSSTTQFHAKYKSEPREDEWASFVEQKLATHFSIRELSNVDIAWIGCKTSICEVVAITRDPSLSAADLKRWQAEIYTLSRQDWWQQAQMAFPAFQVSDTGGGRYIFVTHFRRNG